MSPSNTNHLNHTDETDFHRDGVTRFVTENKDTA